MLVLVLVLDVAVGLRVSGLGMSMGIGRRHRLDGIDRGQRCFAWPPHVGCRTDADGVVGCAWLGGFGQLLPGCLSRGRVEDVFSAVEHNRDQRVLGFGAESARAAIPLPLASPGGATHSAVTPCSAQPDFGRAEEGGACGPGLGTGLELTFADGSLVPRIPHCPTCSCRMGRPRPRRSEPCARGTKHRLAPPVAW